MREEFRLLDEAFELLKQLPPTEEAAAELWEDFASETLPELAPLGRTWLAAEQAHLKSLNPHAQQLVSILSGAYLGNLTHSLKDRGAIDVADLRAAIDASLDRVEATLVKELGVVAEDEMLIWPSPTQESA